MFIFCLALVGAGAMVFNFLQGLWAYSVYLTLREREAIVYLLLLAGQIVHSTFFLIGDDDGQPAGAF